MTYDPHVRSETIAMPHTPPTQKFVPSTPAVRQQEVDWRALTDDEQQAVKDYQEGRAPLSIVPPKGRVYLTRHHPRLVES